MIAGDEESEFVIGRGLVWPLPALVISDDTGVVLPSFLHLWRAGVELEWLSRPFLAEAGINHECLEDLRGKRIDFYPGWTPLF